MRLERDGSAYKFVPATGMYKRVDGDGPTWFDPEGSQENFLEARGWGVISRPGADANDESAEDFVGDGAAYVPAFTTYVHTDGPLELAAALLACGVFCLRFYLRWLRTFFSICMRSRVAFLFDTLRSRVAARSPTLHCNPIHCHCTRF